jgi:hypothetical protein
MSILAHRAPGFHDALQSCSAGSLSGLLTGIPASGEFYPREFSRQPDNIEPSQIVTVK